MTQVLESDREACSGSCLTILQEEQPDLILSPASSFSAASTAQTPAAGRRMAEHTLNAEDMALNKLGDIEARPRKALRPIDMNHYATKKSAAQSMLDVALLMANSSQLKTVLYVGPQYRFYVPLIVLLSLSIALQVIVGLLLVFIVKYDLNDVRKHAKLNRMNNVATVFVFFTVLINIFITALGFQGHTISSPASSVLSVPEPKLSPLPIDLNRTGGI